MLLFNTGRSINGFVFLLLGLLAAEVTVSFALKYAAEIDKYSK
jgi:hypothetical protein